MVVSREKLSLTFSHITVVIFLVLYLLLDTLRNIYLWPIFIYSMSMFVAVQVIY